MIKINIMSSNILDQIGIYHFGFNQIVFSSSKKANINTDLTFALEVIKDRIFLINPNNNMLVNKKFAGELYSLKKGDYISYESFSLEIIDFNFTSYLSVRETLNKNTSEIIKNHPKVHAAITQLREEMKNV